MIDKININSILFDGSTPNQPDRSKPALNQNTDATLQISFEALIEQATKMPPADADAVNRARQLLESGQLDNPANIKQAAENIASFGVWINELPFSK
jgi:hypothetical protein